MAVPSDPLPPGQGEDFRSKMHNHADQAGFAARLGAAALFMLVTLVAMPQAFAKQSDERHTCLRCHAMETLAYRDPATREILDLSIDPRALSHSVHGEMECTECHKKGYRRYPHPESVRQESLSCVGCHEDDPAEATYQLKRIESEYDLSVHVAPGAKHADRFSCHTCHDPHAFSVSRVGTDLAEVVRAGNAVCLGCHKRVANPAFGLHAWLPKREAHWTSVRCVECHTPTSDEPSRISHRILPADESHRDCVSCHSRDALLLGRLYRYRSAEDLERRGLFAQALFNEAYVVGMSRSPLLDAISLAILGLTLLGLIAHGVGRYLTHRRRSNRS